MREHIIHLNERKGILISRMAKWYCMQNFSLVLILYICCLSEVKMQHMKSEEHRLRGNSIVTTVVKRK
jgi:hypothetical protein